MGRPTTDHLGQTERLRSGTAGSGSRTRRDLHGRGPCPSCTNWVLSPLARGPVLPSESTLAPHPRAIASRPKDSSAPKTPARSTSVAGKALRRIPTLNNQVQGMGRHSFTPGLKLGPLRPTSRPFNPSISPPACPFNAILRVARSSFATLDVPCFDYGASITLSR